MEVFTAWFSHFLFSTLTLSVVFFAGYLTLVNLESGKMSFWNDLEDKFKLLLEAKNLYISEDKVFIYLSKTFDSSQAVSVGEFAKYHGILLRTKGRIKNIYNKSLNITILLIISIFYSGIVLVINSPDITIGKVAVYFVPIVTLIYWLFLFLPIYEARNELTLFIDKQSNYERKLEQEHGEFSKLEIESK